MPAETYKLTVTLPLHNARTIIDAALAEGRRRGLQPLTVVVLDAGGHTVSLDREDGSGIRRVEVASGKAGAALGLGFGSGTVAARNQGRDAFLASVATASDGTFVPVPGGVLVLDPTQRVVGAVGVSGDASPEDEACALAGIEAAGYTPGLDPAE